MDNGGALPEDLLFEILIHLPVQSLLRFSCVSRYWFALIKSPNFIDTHLRRGYKQESLLLKRRSPEGNCHVLTFHCLHSPNLFEYQSIPFPLLDHLIERECCDFFATCNGLVCFASDTSVGLYPESKVDEQPFVVLLCNPALREVKVLDPTPSVCSDVCFALIVGWGFGFDAKTNAYKVIQLRDVISRDYARFGYMHSYYIRADLYDSRTNSWRLIDAVVPEVINNPRFQLFFNGACHWGTVNNCILSFDLSIEVFRLFEYPSFIGVQTNLMVFNQCLSLMHFVDSPMKVIDIWVMKEYGVKESWTKQLTIGPCSFCNPLVFVKNERLLVETFYHQLASYELHSNKITRFDLYGINSGHPNELGYMRAGIFVESLISLK